MIKVVSLQGRLAGGQECGCQSLSFPPSQHHRGSRMNYPMEKGGRHTCFPHSHRMPGLLPGSEIITGFLNAMPHAESSMFATSVAPRWTSTWQTLFSGRWTDEARKGGSYVAELGFKPRSAWRGSPSPRQHLTLDLVVSPGHHGWERNSRLVLSWACWMERSMGPGTVSHSVHFCGI